MNTSQEAIARLRHSSAAVRAEAARYLSDNATTEAAVPGFGRPSSSEPLRSAWCPPTQRWPTPSWNCPVSAGAPAHEPTRTRGAESCRRTK